MKPDASAMDSRSLRADYAELKLAMHRFHVASLRLAGKVSQKEERNYFNSIHAEIPDPVGTSCHAIVLDVSSILHKSHARLHEAMDESKGHTNSCEWLIFDIPSVLTAFTQKHESVRSDLQNLTAVATFFSSITATTLSVSFNGTSTSGERTTNVLWFSSLLLSVASATSSMLGLSWHSASGWAPKYEISSISAAMKYVINTFLFCPRVFSYPKQQANTV